jgi:hypothetical protein
MIFFIVASSLSTMGCGVPLTADRPDHDSAWKPGKPLSAMVGSVGVQRVALQAGDGQRAQLAGLARAAAPRPG